MKKPNSRGYFGQFGGRYIPETLSTCLDEVKQAYSKIKKSKKFKEQLRYYLKEYAGRPTSLYFASNLSKLLKNKIYFKREDLLHTGAHKINNALGQALLAKFMKKQRIIAETGAGQHGVAVATVASLLGFKCDIYMGKDDIQRQSTNVFRMKVLGAKVIPVNTGSKTLKDACNEAFRDWVTNVRDTYYLLGSAVGPHPYPMMVRDFQSIIGRETRKQIQEKESRNPDLILACVGGGSNSIGIFYEFLEEPEVAMIGVEAGGLGITTGMHAARFTEDGALGVLQGTFSHVLQDENGQISTTHSVSAGLDYASVGPEHSYLRDIGRISYTSVTDDEALEAFQLLSQLEGIIPALESAHAVAYAVKHVPGMPKDNLVVINLSGRGDKDVQQAAKIIAEKKH